MAQPYSALAVVKTPVPTASDDLRADALRRLYMRRETVDELIRSLEQYQLYEGGRRQGRAVCIPINASPKWS